MLSKYLTKTDLIYDLLMFTVFEFVPLDFDEEEDELIGFGFHLVHEYMNVIGVKSKVTKDVVADLFEIVFDFMLEASEIMIDQEFDDEEEY